MSLQAFACIHVDALRHNLRRVKQLAPHACVYAVIKADAYGHGLERVAEALSDSDAFAVGTIAEALALRRLDHGKAILVLQGLDTPQSIQTCIEQRFEIVIHAQHQIDWLGQYAGPGRLSGWLKMDTGMHRLGIAMDAVENSLLRLQKISCIAKPVHLMSHLACADEPQDTQNSLQLEQFADIAKQLSRDQETGQCRFLSLCNSAAIVAFPQAHYDWVRPGIMLYGISPLQEKTTEVLGIQPAMTLKSRLIAINHLGKGDAVGYGATWECPEDMPVGVVGIGYGDGYPRHVPPGTPVLIHGQRVPLVGRVSMDLITIDLRTLLNADVGDEVILWGQGLPVEEIASLANTIAYELVCKLTSRVEFLVET